MPQAPAPKDVYKTAEVCKAADVAPYVLKYWLTEFSCLSADKDKSPNRTFSAKEVAIIARIRQLLYDEGFTIAGAKKKIDAEIAAGAFESGGAKPKKAASAPASASAPAAAPVLPLTPAPVPTPAAPAKPAAPSVDPRKIAKELRDILKLIR